MKREYAIILPLVFLTGCSSQQMAESSAAATQVATAAAQLEQAAGKPSLADLQTDCAGFDATAGAVKTVAAGGAKTTVGYIAAPGQAFCKIVENGQMPDNADSNSTPWLKDLETAINTAKALAPLAEVALALAADKQTEALPITPVSFK